MEMKMELPENFLPKAPCRKCLENPERMRTNGAVAICYCEHNSAGAILPLRDWKPAASWTVYCPITLKEWTQFLSNLDRRFAELIEADKRESEELAELPAEYFHRA